MVNWRKLLRVEVERADAPEHVEDDESELIELTSSDIVLMDDPFITPRPLFDDIMAEVAAMAAPALSWLRWRPAPKRPRWDPVGLVPTMVVIELTDGMVRHG